MLKAIIFDFDGVIVDTESAFLQAWQEIYAEYGYTLSLDDWVAMLGSSSNPAEPYEFLESHLGYALDRVALYDRHEQREVELLERESLMPGVMEVIGRAKQAQLRLGIASSSRRSWVAGLLSRFGILDEFDSIKTADEVTLTKPHPHLYLAVLEELNVAARDALAIEDTPNGMLAAKRAGLFCVAVPNNVTRHLPSLPADLTIDSLEHLPMSALFELPASPS